MKPITEINIKDVVSQIKKEQIPVIIFGAGIVGKVLYYFCQENGINVACFCDNSSIKAQSSLCNEEVISISKLKAKYKDAIFLVSVADIQDIVKQLNELGFTKWYAAGVLLKGFDIIQLQIDEPIDFVEYVVGTCILCHENYLNPEKLFLRSIDIIITERCSLRCRDCSNLMQYYEEPKDCDIDNILESIDKFCTVVDEVNEFRVIGGEPFMNREWPLIIKKLTDEQKVKNVVVYTNGTIVPDEKEITYLQNNKVLIFITDYGTLSRNLKDLTQLLDRNNVSYYVRKAAGWTKCGTIMKFNRSEKEQKEIFKNCCAKNLITLSDGKLYRCPFAANAYRLSAIPNYKDDYIDLFQQSSGKLDVEEMKNNLNKYLLHKEYLKTCEYCNGRPLSDLEIEPAVQVDRPLKYEKLLSSLNQND